MSSQSMSPLGTPAAGPASAHAGGRFNTIDPLRILRRHLLLMIICLVLSIAVGVSLWLGMRQWQPTWLSEARLFASPITPKAYAPLQNTDMAPGSLEALATFIRNQDVRIRSDRVLNQVFASQQVRETRWFRDFGQTDGERTENARLVLQEDNTQLNLAQQRGTTLMRITLSATSPANPGELRIVLDNIVRVYMEDVRQSNNDSMTGLRRTFEQERRDAESEFNQLQLRMRQYFQQQNLANLEAAGSEAQITYNDLARQQSMLQIRARGAKDMYDALLTRKAAGELVVTPEMVYTAQASPTVAARDENIRRLRVEKSVLLDRFGTTHASVRDIDLRIDAIEQEKQQEVDRLLAERQEMQLETAKQTASTYEAQLASLQPQIEEARGRMQDLTLKLRDYQQIAELARNAVQRREKADDMLNQMRITDARPDSVGVFQQQTASVPQMTWPLPQIVIPGVVLVIMGLVTGVLFLRELVDQRVKLPADLRNMPHAELVGVIPQSREDPSGPSTIDSVVARDPGGLMAEAFRQVRAEVLTKMDRRGYKTLMVVGARAESGVSSIVNNLAISLGFNGRKVLVLDANFRRPAQHRLFGIAGERGLVEVLRGEARLEETIVHQEAMHVDVLPTGASREAAPELLEGAAFRSLLSHLETQYDLILIDAPPALLASDAQMLARQTDAALVVVRAVAETRGMVSRMIRQLDGQRADLLGIVLNSARSSTGGYFKDNYKQFYNYRQRPRSTGGRKRGAPARA